MIHPAVITAYYSGIFACVFMFSHPAFVALILIFAIFTAIFYCGKAAFFGMVRTLVFFGVIIILSNVLTSHRGVHILFYLYNNPITAEAAVAGLVGFAMLSCMLILFLSFNRLIDSGRFLYVFARLAPKTAFVTSMTIRYFYLYRNRAKEIADVRSIGGEDRGGFANKVRYYARIFSALVSWCLEEGMKTALVLKSREYGRHTRTSYVLYKFIVSDGICLFAVAALFTLLALGAMTGAGQYNIYPKLMPPSVSLRDMIFYVLLLLYLAIPLVTEGVAAVKRRMPDGSGICQ